MNFMRSNVLSQRPDTGDEGFEGETDEASSLLPGRSTLDTVSLVAAVLALYAILKLGLLSALLAGLLIAQLVHSAVPVLSGLGIANRNLGKAIALIAVAVLVTTVVAGSIFA